jgi:hypothetical protein
MEPVAPDAAISVTLAAQEWNQVLAILMDAPLPWRLSSVLIPRLTQQVQAGAEALPAAKPNGADEHASH